MTAGGLLCRMYTGWKRDNPQMMEAITFLMANKMPKKDEPDLYYWYYGTQVFHHIAATLGVNGI